MIPMKPVEGVPDRSSVKPGMAFFAATGPAGMTCGKCVHRGPTGRCAMYRKLMSGKHGPPVEPDWRACKYFEYRNRSSE